MTVVVDTSVLIDHLRGRRAAFEAIDGALSSGEPLVASVLTKVEVLAGMRPEEEPQVRLLFGVLDWQDVDDPLAERAGALATSYARSHPGIDPVDYVIAATVERWSADLWTTNVEHFPMLSGLRPPYG